MNRIVGLITANYEMEQLGVLTKERTIAALPFGGRYRLIDFTLSNMVNSGIKSVGLIIPFKYRSILDHVAAGKPWGLDHKKDALHILQNSVFGMQDSYFSMFLKDITRNKEFFMRSPAPYYAISASNMIMSVDYEDVFKMHLDTNADITMVYDIAKWDSLTETGLVLDGGCVSEIKQGVAVGEPHFLHTFIINRETVMSMIKWYSFHNSIDFMEALKSELSKLKLSAYQAKGYSRSIACVKDYYEANMDILNPEIAGSIFNIERPVYTKVRDSAPTRYDSSAAVKNSMVSAGCKIYGTVENSVLFRGVIVEPGAVVKDSIIMQSCVIKKGAEVVNAIVDKSNVVEENNKICGTAEKPYIIGKNALTF